MKISVVVPVYNVERSLLLTCFKSLKRQSLTSDDYEVIVVDDFSDAPETLSVLQAHESSDRFSVVRHTENLGLNESRRSGVRAASGDFVVFVDGDDMLTRDGLELLRMEAHRTGADVVTSGFQRWNPISKKLSAAPFFGIPFPNELTERLTVLFRCDRSFTMCGRLFRKSLLTDEVFDMADRVYHEDIITLPRLISKASRISHVTKTVYYYTEAETSITSNFTPLHADGAFLAFSEWKRVASDIGLASDFEAAIQHGIQRLSSLLVRRCIQATNLEFAEKRNLLARILVGIRAHGVTAGTAETPIVTALFEFDEISQYLDDFELELRWRRVLVPDKSVEPLTHRRDFGELSRSISNMAFRLKGKIVFIGQVDYQVKNAALAARELRKLGYDCVVLDNSGFVAGGKRKFSDEDPSLFWRTEHIQIPGGPYGVDWLSTARAVITFNDFNDDIRDAVEYRQLLGFTTIAAIEGINDFLRVDFRHSEDDPYRFLPYRRTDTVFLAGRNDARFFQDRDTRIVGLPIVQALRQKRPTFPNHPIAALNVNFTYGVLEDRRDDFLSAALEGIKRAGFEYEITQHPVDGAKLENLKVSNRTQYQLIDETSVFVSRFATGILEALASGKPAIYFNPHGEQVDKFTNPMGAFEVALTANELTEALRRVQTDIASGVDFRKRAKDFLAEHANFKLRGASVAKQFAQSIIDVLNASANERSHSSDFFFSQLEGQSILRPAASDTVVGEFSRSYKASLSDEDVIAHILDYPDGTMIDVGANLGDSCDMFLGKGWAVHAFEPDPFCRGELKKIWPKHRKLVINSQAVDEVGNQKRAFFVSDESTGIGTLAPFTDGHEELCKVQTTTLAQYYDSAAISHVDFLKIDVEGFDKFVLDGFPWDLDSPKAILAEFEDKKTVPQGYSVHDLAALLQTKGYTVYVSEWHPIERYGVAHDWRRFSRYSSEANLSESWGNLLGFKDDPGFDVLQEVVKGSIKFSAPISAGFASTNDRLEGSSARQKAPVYAKWANELRDWSPKSFRALQIARRFGMKIWRHKNVLTLAGLLVGVVTLLSGFAPFDALRSSFALFAGTLIALMGLSLLACLSYLCLRDLTNEIRALKVEADKSHSVAARLSVVERELATERAKVKSIEAEVKRTNVEFQQLDVSRSDLG